MVAWIASLLLGAAPAAAPPSPLAPRCIQLVSTTDVHGHLEAEPHKAGDVSVLQGGLPTFAGYLDILRAKYPDQVLLLDSGDLFQGTVPSNLSKGAAVVAAYNALHYDAAALGNHEFDYGASSDPRDLLGSIKDRVREANHVTLAANVYEVASHKRPTWTHFAPSHLFTVNGIKVGVIGAATPETPLVTIPLNVASLEFHDPAPDIIEQSKALRAQGAQVVVLATHIGGRCADVSDPNDLSSCEKDSDLFKLLHALPKGTLDAIVGGHTHQYIAQNVDGIPVSQAGFYGHSFGWMQLCVAGGQVTSDIHPPTDICLSTWNEGGCRERKSSTGSKPAEFLGQPVVADAAVQHVIQPYLDKVRAFQEAKVGVTIAEKLVRLHDKASPLGTLVAEGIRSAVPGAQIGLTNGGGVRADLPAGAIIFKEVFEVLPFDNEVVGLRLTGKELYSFIVAPLRAGHGYPQLAGARLVIDDLEHRDGHLEMSDGSKVIDDKMYLLATNDFLANGGDGAKPVVSTLPADRRTPMHKLVRDAFIDYLKTLPQPIKAPHAP